MLFCRRQFRAREPPVVEVLFEKTNGIKIKANHGALAYNATSK